MLLAAVLASLLCSCLAPAGTLSGSSPLPVADDGDMTALVREYATDEGDLRRWLSVSPSLTRLDRLDTFADGWERRLEAVDVDALDAGGRVDRLLLLGHIEHRRRQRADERERATRLAEHLPFADAIVALEEARWSLEPFVPADVAGDLDGLAASAEALADEPPEVSAVDALWLAARLHGLVSALDTWRGHHGPYDPSFGWWVDEPADRLEAALTKYATALREDRAEQTGEDDDPLVGDPIGRDALLDDLAHAWIADTPEQLVALGEEQLAWCHAELERAAEELGFGDDWKAALEHVKSLHVPPGEQDDLVLALGHEAVTFLEERELVTIPELCAETWRVRMLSARAQRTLPFAAYGGQHMLVAFPTASMDHDTKRQAMRGNNVPFTRNVTPHELIPGHHLQGYMANRHATHRQLFATPFLGEGWALHWEFLFWDLGWASTPEERIGMLFWRAHRAARIVFSLKFHLGEMTAEEAVDLLVDRVGHERENARAEVRRSVGGGYSPLYQCAYMVGALQIQALYEELVRNGQMTPRAFHDAVLQAGPIPIEMIRALLTGTELPADHAPSWSLSQG
jgi:hypothetical protein